MIRSKTILAAFFVLTSLKSFSQVAAENIPVHDPAVISEGKVWYLFATGRGISVWSSADKVHWERRPAVFSEPPVWAKEVVPGFKNHIWAPDISFYKGQYYLFYSVSAFGKNTSAIGLATNSTLNSKAKDYRWTDRGIIIRSVPGKTNWNAIDPNIIADKKGNNWLAFGSFWEGIKLVKLTPDRLHAASATAELPTIASRHAASVKPYAGANAIEAPFIYKKSGWYYLFVSVDYCCRGVNSTYKIWVGRSRSPQGPYADKEGHDMAAGGGTLVLQGDEHWHGLGHNAVFADKNHDYLVFHAYDAADNGKAKLRIEQITWSKGWPVIYATD